MIYLDNNATTPLAPEVLEVFIESLSHFGNPSSAHSHGQKTKNLITKSRRAIASFFNKDPVEILFNSGATEGLNFLIQGLTSKKGHLITTSIEHPCVYSQFQSLKERGWDVNFLKPLEDGKISFQSVAQAIRPDTILISIMAANNETGVINDWMEIASLAEQHGIAYIVDGVQLLGKELFEIPSGVTGMAFSGHKIHAPKGVGFVYLKKGTKISPHINGGGQERGFRGGTENVSGIVALQKAIEMIEPIEFLRDTFEKALLEKIPHVQINGTSKRIGNTSNISFPDMDGESLLLSLDLNGISASYGSACSSGALEPSRTLTSMGLSRERIRSSLRFSFSKYNTLQEIETVVSVLEQLIKIEYPKSA